MSEEQIKKATELAQKEFQQRKEEQAKKLVKEIVQNTLERIEKLEEEIKELQEEKKQLKQTIDDLKNGDLGLLKEKLDKDKKAQEYIPFKIIEIVREQIPYPTYPNFPWTVWYGGNSCTATGNNVKWAVQGTYCLNSGHSVTLR